ncbi:MAG: ferric reductase-like transmembrane domain-containing protein, partial [Oscillospiraceae bacterium]|nr:ferric reductase-like transmembrane domain-containing protein [Oscillospiraceae bacterium]
MLFLIAVVLAAGFAWIAAKPLQQKPLPFYIGAAVVTVMMILIGQTHVPLGETVFLKYAVDLFNKGALAAALWCVVAYTGALPNGSKAIKRLMPARGELSILAAIVTISHALTWSISYIQRILKFSAAGKSPAADFIANCIVCVLLMCIMLPLTIISFKAVRRKMNAKKWKMIQRAAYLFYALIYVHILIVLIPKVQASRSGALLSVAAYSAVFIGYAVLRLRKLYFRKRQPERTFLPNAVCLTLFALCVAGITGAGVKAAEAQKMKAANAATAETPQETTAAATSAATEPSETAAAPTEAATEQPTKPAEMTEETTGPTEPSETEEVSEAAETSEEEHAPEEQQDAQNQQDPQEQPEPEP